MKKLLSSLILLALAFTATPALAKQGGDHHDNRHKSIRAQFVSAFNKDVRKLDNRFVIKGTVATVSGINLTLNVQSQVNIDSNVVNGQVTVATSGDTKIVGQDKTILTLANLQAGDKVVVAGTISGSVLTATHIWDRSRPVTKAYGEVIAKTDTTITIKNNVTGQSQTVAVNEDTNIAINGEIKTAADVSVGDTGWVKFKNTTGTFVAKVIRLFR